MFSERETKCPRLKEKIYKPRGFYSIKNTVGKVLSLRRRLPGCAIPVAPLPVPSGGSGCCGATGPSWSCPRSGAAAAQLGHCPFVSNWFSFFVIFFFFFVAFFLFCFFRHNP